MGYTIEHHGQMFSKKFRNPQMVFKFDAAGGNRDTVRRWMNEMSLIEGTHYRIHPTTMPYDSLVRVVWVSDEAYVQAKMVFS